jgi:hypothetical protein
VKISFDGKAYVMAGGVFVRQRIEGEVNDVHALATAMAIAFQQALGSDFSLLRGGASKMSVATIIVDLRAHTDAQDSLKGMINENSVQVLHSKGQLPRPNQLQQNTPTASK